MVGTEVIVQEEQLFNDHFAMQDIHTQPNRVPQRSKTPAELCCMRWEFSFHNSPTQNFDGLGGLIQLLLISQGQHGIALQLKPNYFGPSKYFLLAHLLWGMA